MKTYWLMLLALSPSSALADPPPTPQLLLPPPRHAVVIDRPEWLKRPSALQYPKLAVQAHVSGSTRILCVVTAEGLLEKCEVLSETPPGYGFGQAGLNMTNQMQMRPPTRDGHPVDGATVVIPFRFQLPGELSSPAPPPKP